MSKEKAKLAALLIEHGHTKEAMEILEGLTEATSNVNKTAGVIYTTNPDPWPEEIETLKAINIHRYVLGTLVEIKDFVHWKGQPKEAEAWTIYRYRVQKFGIFTNDLKQLIKLGLLRIQQNEPGFIDLYFNKETKLKINRDRSIF